MVNTKLRAGLPWKIGRQHKGHAIELALSFLGRAGGPPCALAANIVIARWLGPADFGRYLTLLSAALVAGGIAAHGVGRVLVREVAVRKPDEQRSAVRSLTAWALRLVGPLSLLVTALLLIWLTWGRHLGAPISSWSNRAAAVGLVGCWVLLVGVSSFLTGLKRVAAAQMVRNLFKNGILLGGVVILGAIQMINIDRLLWLQCLAYVITIGVGIYILKRSLPSVTSETTVIGSAERRHLYVSANGFFAMAVANLLFLRLDVVIVNAIGGSAESGVFGAAARMAQFAQIAGLVWLAWLQPRLAHDARKGEWKRIQSKINFVLIASMITTIIPSVAAWLYAPALVRVFGASFGAAVEPFRWLLVGQIIWAVVVPFSALLAMTGDERRLATVIWIQLALTLAASYPLVRHYGASGAAFAWAGGLVVANLYIGWCGLRKIRAGVVANRSGPLYEP